MMSRVWDTKTSSHTQKLVLLALADNANDEGVCWPSITTLSKKCELSRRAVMSQIKLLVGHQREESRKARIGPLIQPPLLEVIKSQGQSNTYKLLVKPVHQCSPCTSEAHSPTSEARALPLVKPVHPTSEARAPITVIEPSFEPSKNRKGAPSIEEVKFQAQKIGLPEKEAQRFFDYYSSNGWKVGKIKMVSMPHALAGWRTRWEERGRPGMCLDKEEKQKRLRGLYADKQYPHTKEEMEDIQQKIKQLEAQ